MMTNSDMDRDEDEPKAVRGQDKGVADDEMNDEDLADQINKNLRMAKSHWHDWRIRAREDFDFYAGVQWDEVDSAKLAEEGRPAVVFNRIVKTINAVIGLEVQNRQEVKYMPRHLSDNGQIMGSDELNESGYSDAMNGASKWVRDENNAEDEESEAFADTLICGIGWTETRMDYDDNPEGMIVKDRLDPLMVYVDPDAKKRNFEDARWVAQIREFTRKEIRAMFPDLEYIEQPQAFWTDELTDPHNADEDFKYINDQSEKFSSPNKIACVQYQYWVKKPIYKFVSPTDTDGNILTINQKKYTGIKKILDALGIKPVKMHKKEYRQVFMVGNKIADRMTLDCERFTIRAMTGLRDRNRNIYFGIVAMMKDPQRWANKWLSQIQYILNTNSKGGLLYESGAVKNVRKLEDDWAKPGSNIELNPGGLGKIQPKEQAQYPDGIDRLLNYANSAITDVPGINLELMGMAGRDQPNVLEQSRKEAGVTILATFFDSLRRYRKIDGRILAHYIREYLADGRLIRIVGSQGAKYIPLIKDRMAFAYDIVVDDSPTSPNNKERIFAILNALIPTVMEAGIPIPPDILDYAPLPDDFIQKWKKLIVEQSQPDPIQEEVKQIQMLMTKLAAMKEQANIQKIGSETAKNYAEAEKAHSVANEQEALAMQKFGVLQHDQNMKMDAMQSDQQRKDVELWLTHQRKMLEIELENRLKNLSMGNAPSLNTIQ